MLLRKVYKIKYKITFSNLSAITNVNIYNPSINYNNYLRTKLLHTIVSPILSQSRNYTSNKTENLKYITLFPEEKLQIYPNTLKILSSVYKVYVPLRNKLKIDEFFQGSRQALFVVSAALANEDYDSIEDLVEPDVLQNVKIAIQNLNAEQKKLLEIKSDNSLLGFLYDIQITYDNNAEPKFVEIMVVYYSSPKSENSKMESYLKYSVRDTSQMLISNYQFIYEFKKDSDSFWTVNKINYKMILN